MVLKTIFYTIFVLTASVFSQEKPKYSYPRDTTYTLKIAYSKYKKDYPSIKAVEYNFANCSMQKSITYTAPTGRPLILDIFSITSDKDPVRPAVILVHGGGWSSGDRNLMYPLADYLAQHGHIAIAVEYRLSPEAQYPAAVNDIKSAISWIIKNGRENHIDKNKIALLGCSAGAQLAGLVGLSYQGDQEHNQKNIYAIINIDGIMDFTTPEARKHEDDPNRESTPAGRWLGGRYAEKPELWKEASPVYYVHENSPAILFINSSQSRFHVGRDETIKKLDKFSIYSEVHTFDDAPHSFWLFEPWFERTAQYTEQFLQRVLNKKQ
jgi:acetyl esterase/lipase